MFLKFENEQLVKHLSHLHGENSNEVLTRQISEKESFQKVIALFLLKILLKELITKIHFVIKEFTRERDTKVCKTVNQIRKITRHWRKWSYKISEVVLKTTED